MPEHWGEMSQPTELLFPILCGFTFQKLHDFKNSDLFPLDLAHTFHEGWYSSLNIETHPIWEPTEPAKLIVETLEQGVKYV